MATVKDLDLGAHVVDTSPDFYRRYADRYATNQIDLVQRVWTRSSHPALEGNHSLLNGLVELAPGPRGLDAGCGAGAVDVAELVSRGLDVIGFDAIPENINAAVRLHPSLKSRVTVADLSQPMAYADSEFDFVMCNAVIQHLGVDEVYETTIPELARVLRTGGILQLVFKCGQGIVTLRDPDYDEVRSFRLFDERRVMSALEGAGMALVPAENQQSLGGVMHFTNNNDIEHCAVWMRKIA